MKLEKTIAEFLKLIKGEAFNVTAFEMTHDGEGWSVNTPFRIATGVTREEIPGIVRERWEVIAANYGRKRVSALLDIAWDESHLSLESDCFPIVDIAAME